MLRVYSKRLFQPNRDVKDGIYRYVIESLLILANRKKEKEKKIYIYNIYIYIYAVRLSAGVLLTQETCHVSLESTVCWLDSLPSLHMNHEESSKLPNERNYFQSTARPRTRHPAGRAVFYRVLL